MLFVNILHALNHLLTNRLKEFAFVQQRIITNAQKNYLNSVLHLDTPGKLDFASWCSWLWEPTSFSTYQCGRHKFKGLCSHYLHALHKGNLCCKFPYLFFPNISTPFKYNSFSIGFHSQPLKTPSNCLSVEDD